MTHCWSSGDNKLEGPAGRLRFSEGRASQVRLSEGRAGRVRCTRHGRDLRSKLWNARHSARDLLETAGHPRPARVHPAGEAID